MKPIVYPFWESLPYSDVYLSLTPDILHQLYQGVMKHLVAWVTAAFSKKDLDARCRCLPPNFSIRSLTKGITSLSRLTGKEHADMCQILLGLIVDMDLPNGISPLPLIRSTRALLDFLYLAQYPVHTSETLRLLRQSLHDFHSNKHFFVEPGIREDFNLPKLHSLAHYVESIELFGTTDNYNTEYTERLHIDLANDAYRATNHRDEYAQMTVWLERKEKILRHQTYLEWRLGNSDKVAMRPLSMGYNGVLTLTKWPSKKAVDLDELVTNYGAIFFREALRRYLVLSKHSGPPLTPNQLEHAILYTNLPFTSVPVYHKLKFTTPTDSARTKHFTLDAIYVRPERQSKKGLTIPARFDTALVNIGSGGETGVEGMIEFASMFARCSENQQATVWGRSGWCFRYWMVRPAHPLSVSPTLNGFPGSPLLRVTTGCTNLSVVWGVANVWQALSRFPLSGVACICSPSLAKWFRGIGLQIMYLRSVARFTSTRLQTEICTLFSNLSSESCEPRSQFRFNESYSLALIAISAGCESGTIVDPIPRLAHIRIT